MKPLNIRTPWMDLQRFTDIQAALFHLVLFTSISLAGGQSGSGSGMVGTTSSSLFVASKDLSTSGWEQYKTESLPSEDLSQCLARCMLHQNQWWNGLHSGWVKYFVCKYDNPHFLRCNAVSFGSNVCEEAHIMQLQEADSGETQKSFLIRSEEERSVYLFFMAMKECS